MFQTEFSELLHHLSRSHLNWGTIHIPNLFKHCHPLVKSWILPKNWREMFSWLLMQLRKFRWFDEIYFVHISKQKCAFFCSLDFSWNRLRWIHNWFHVKMWIWYNRKISHFRIVTMLPLISMKFATYLMSRKILNI